MVVVSCYPEAVTLERTKEREKKEKIRARKRPRETTPSRTRTSRNRAEFGRNERSRDEVYRPTFRFFSLSLRAPSHTSLSRLRKCTRKNPPSGFLSLPQRRERNLGSHAKTRVHKKINKKSLYPKRAHRANVYRVRKLRYRRRKMRTLVAKEVDNMIFVCVCGGETSKVMEMMRLDETRIWKKTGFLLGLGFSSARLRYKSAQKRNARQHINGKRERDHKT